MSNSTKRDNDISKLHPAIRQKVIEIQETLAREKIPLKVYEGFRTPELQVEYTKRKPPITWVGPWHSIHQYGLAVDFVAFENGNWSWDTSGGREKWWLRMHELAKERGMRPIRDKKGNLKELAHIQLADISSSDLAKGKYPEGGDHVWSECLCDMIDNWRGSPAAPPRPRNLPERPPIPEDQRDEIEFGGVTDLSPIAETAMSAAQEDARFQKLHEFVKKWEGGFVNNPHDKGGATNMGITHATLAAWRKRDCTVEDVRTLSREEADAILRANYYAVCRCGEMPDRLAMVVYNGAVLHGPKRSIEFLQRAFNDLGMTADGMPLEVDGRIGTKTITAAKQTDASVLADAYMNIQDAYFREHEDFEHFGAGWLNRMASLREFVATLPQGAGLRPKTVMKVADRKLDLDSEDVLRVVLAAATGGKSAALAAVLGQVLQQDEREDDSRRRGKTLLKKLLADKLDLDIKDPEPIDLKIEAKKALTPVNAALGEGVGRFLDGKKSVIGVVGILLTVFVPELVNGPLVEFVRSNYAQILTVLATFTGWGFLGKIDKAIREVRT